MNRSLPEIIDRFRGLRVLVIGEAMLDSYLDGRARRISREAPVPIVAVDERHDVAGGAANTAANARALGASLDFLSVVGDDAEGNLLKEALVTAGVPVDRVVVEEGRRTLLKTRVLADGQMLVRFDQGTMTRVGSRSEQALIDRLRAGFAGSDLVIISDYGYGILTPAVVQELTELQARTPRVLLADAKDLFAYRHCGLTAVKPNYEEAVNLLGVRRLESARERLLQVASAGDRLLDMTGAQVAAVTLDSEGGLVFERGSEPYRTYARPAGNSRAAGAGDTFIATLGMALAAGAGTPQAAELASAASAVVVGKDGTACCSSRELRAFLSLDEKLVNDLDELAERLTLERTGGRRIVFTNGCFDILHRGHITYLNRAKALGDILVVGLNSDESVRRLKGPARPINSVADRAEVLAALSCVDHIVPFDEDTPERIIEALRPDLFVKGGDYTRETLPEAALVERLGGHVQILPYLEDRSTSAIIERIQGTVQQARGT